MGAEEKLLERVQPKVDDHLISAGLFKTKGSLGRRTGASFGLLGAGVTAMRNRDARDSTAPLPPVMILAVSATRVYAFEASEKLTFKVKDLVESWPRADLQATVQTKKATHQVTLEPADGTRHELEILRLGGNRYSDDLVRLLAEAS